MQNEQQVIRNLITTWHQATASGDLQTIMDLMSEDVVFLVAGQPPMRGRDAFATAFHRVLEHHKIESTGEIQEIQIVSDLAYCWTYLSVTVTSLEDGKARQRTGHSLTILRKQADGSWIISRDANMLTSASSA